MPAGQIKTRAGSINVQPRAEKYSAFAVAKISTKNPPSRLTEGRLAIVTNAGRDAVDAGGAFDESAGCGRRSRVVLTPRRWRQALWKYPRGDGGKKARSPGRARRKPLKTIAQEMPGVPVNLW
jgi:hypothetical protein